MQIKILTFVFHWIFKQQLNWLLILSDWYSRKLELTDLPGHDAKVTSDKTMISVSYERYNSRNRDYCSHFLVTFETTGKILIVFVTNIGKSGVWRVYRVTTGNWRQISKWFVSLIKVIRVEIEIIAAIFQWHLKQQVNF